MATKIKPLKIDEKFGTNVQIDTDEDYISAKGIALEDSDKYLMDIVDNEITFTDPINGQVKLSKSFNHIENVLSKQKDTALDVISLNSQRINFFSFVDSFDDTIHIDDSSTSYSLNNGIELDRNGNLTVNDMFKEQFDNGSFLNIKSSIGCDGNGYLEKVKMKEGSIDSIDKIDSFTIDIDLHELSEKVITIVDLGRFGKDLSAYKYLFIRLLKITDTPIDYSIEIKDNTGRIYNYDQRQLNQTHTYQDFKYSLEKAFVKLNSEHIRYFIIKLRHRYSNIPILEHQDDNGSRIIFQNKEVKKVFSVEQKVICQRIKLNLKRSSIESLNVTITNSFEIPLATACLQPKDIIGFWGSYELIFDNAIDLIPNNDYHIILTSNCPKQRPWLTDMSFSLYRPLSTVNEKIYIDKFMIEKPSVYRSTSSFISREINLGITPISLESFHYSSKATNISSEVKFAKTRSELSSISWQSDALSNIIPYKWFQYKLLWTEDNQDSDIVRNVRLDYSVLPGKGSAIIISTALNYNDIPSKYVMNWVDEMNDGTINYYISRDGKHTWTSVTSDDKGILKYFAGSKGNQIHLKAIITGNAKLYGWSIATDINFI